ncbi:microfibril-associated glycoprotein 4-like [Anopheles maculipalpis]|uniref:microfibril-associated glycoprotein 4-like n=1 Tax=Anopheles maculipalpis TaxID=1496333 RepID=UPI00215964F4|nr:microfibril-associated glycoprotein 4-like [Anopheles maculipalpis]
MLFGIIALVCLIFSLANGETPQPGGCGFGYEIILAKLESIEQRLVALEAKWENTSPKKVETELSHSIQNEHQATLLPATKYSAPESSHVQTTERMPDASPKPLKPPSSKYPLGVEPSAEQLALGEDNIYSSCREVPSRVSGKFLIRISEEAQPINLLCDMQSIDAGWIVVQNRFNGSESFYRKWADYESGFGSLDGEFWLGLERISLLVNNGQKWEIMVWLKNFQGMILYTKYNKFVLGNATDEYRLKEIRSYLGNGGDSLGKHEGMKFTTYDRDNDPVSYNCAKKHRGGWWYHQQCVTSNLNGVYGNTNTEQSNSWSTMKPYGYGLQATKIMIRELLG